MDQEESSVGMPFQQSQQMQLVHQQDQYLSERGQAIESIESTIHELGSIFQQLAQMVSEQAETVQRYIKLTFSTNEGSMRIRMIL